MGEGTTQKIGSNDKSRSHLPYDYIQRTISIVHPCIRLTPVSRCCRRRRHPLSIDHISQMVVVEEGEEL